MTFREKDIVVLKWNNSDKRIFEIIETWLDCTAHEYWKAVTIKCLNCDLSIEDNDWVYDELEEDLITLKDYIKEIIIKEVWEDKLDIITDPDDLLQFPLPDNPNLSLVDNSLDPDNFVWSLACNLGEEDDELFLKILDLKYDRKNNIIIQKKYYNIGGELYDNIDEAVKYYEIEQSKIEDDNKIEQSKIEQIRKKDKEIDTIYENIISKILF